MRDLDYHKGVAKRAEEAYGVMKKGGNLGELFSGPFRSRLETAKSDIEMIEELGQDSYDRMKKTFVSIFCKLKEKYGIEHVSSATMGFNENDPGRNLTVLMKVVFGMMCSGEELEARASETP